MFFGKIAMFFSDPIGLEWVIVLPVSLIIFIIVGSLFDYIKNKKIKT
jgi:hypothetical protein